jgi:hypothetical protein
MLPQVSRFGVRWAAGCVAAAAIALGGCGTEATPEARVKAVIMAGEAAAEERDLAGLLDLVSDDFRDDRGGGREELKQYLRGYLVMHQSVHLLTRVDSIEFPYRDYARVQLTVGTLGREAAGAAAFDVAGDVYEVALELRLEGDEWKVTRAAWESTRRG